MKIGITGRVQTCVYEVQQNLKDLSLNSKDLHLLFIRLPHPPGKQSRKVGAAGSQHQTVDPEDPTTNLQPHVTKVGAQPHLVDLGQDESGVAVRGQQSLLRRLGGHGTVTTTPAGC